MDKAQQLKLENAELAAKLKGSLLLFIQAFFPILTGRDFIISRPIGRESHFITICRALTKCSRLESLRLLINVPPGHGKSALVSFWIAWCYAKWPDCNFLYISYSKTLATSHTETIKRLMCLPQYKTLFGVTLREDSQAKDAFTTEAGGVVAAFGSAGAITGRNAGNPGLDRFSGCVLLDDMHKPDEISSSVIRESVITNFRETIQQRPRGINVPIVFIGQRLHEQDLPAYFISGEDGVSWDTVILKSIDEAGNALYPEAFPLDMLKIRQQNDRYVFASQHQQEPQPDGGGLYLEDDFPLLDYEPNYYITFITADTAETDDPRNDATVFSFWGMYNIEVEGRKTGVMGLHWIACREIRVEPKNLEREFLDFWQNCARHENPPLIAYIEKKSTGVTLISILKGMRGLKIREIERTRKSGSKSQRFIDIQPYIAAKQVSLPSNGAHTQMCIKHMAKISNNDSHAHDDVCFVAGTLIATPFGSKAIEDIKVGDKVITPMGIGIVSSSGITNYNANVITVHGITGTPNHPIFANGQFKRLDTLSDADKISSLTFRELIQWKYQKLLYSMTSNIVSWGREDIISVKRKEMTRELEQKGFMSRFMNSIAGLRFQQAMWFIIRMGITLITTSVIWSVFRISNIWKNIAKKSHFMPRLSRIREIFTKHKKQLEHGMEVKKEGNGIVRMLEQAYLSLKTVFAKDVGLIIPLQPAAEATFAIQLAMEDIERRICHESQLHALGVQQNSSARSPQVSSNNENSVAANALQTQSKRVVYNITVEGYGVYYANGLLVSNCDTAADAVRIALIDKSLSMFTSKNITSRETTIAALNRHQNVIQLKQRAYGRRD